MTGPASRATSAASPRSSGPTPVCAAFSTATVRPAASAAAATAAVVTVLPTSVPVPVITRIGMLISRAAAHTARAIRATSSSPVTYGGIV